MPFILFSSKSGIPENVASSNIAKELVELGFEQKSEYEWRRGSARLMDAKFDRALEVRTVFPEADYFIILSPHKSEANYRSLTVHIPGNWDSADHGGEPRTLNTSYASMQLALLRAMDSGNKKYGLGFSVNYEVDHHGPTISKPIIFVEIGSSESEWKNPLAAKIIAEAVVSGLDNLEHCENHFGVGGGHYAPLFTKHALENGTGFGHMLPKYRADSVAQDTFAQAVEKNVEKLECILLDKKGVNQAQREKVERLADRFGVEIKRI